ncbi:hypothetical protein Tco_1108849 [Tanacetum coccineum]
MISNEKQVVSCLVPTTHKGAKVRLLWDKPVEDFFSSESESDDDMENYIPPLPYGEFQDWEMVSCPPAIVPPLYCRDVVVAGNIIQTVQTGLRQSYECLASAPIACTARQMVFSSPWLTPKKESGSPLQTALVCFSNPLIALLFFDVATSFDSAVHRVHVVSFDAAVLDAAATVSAACIIAARVHCFMLGICDAAVVPADYVSAGHVLVSADRDRIC